MAAPVPGITYHRLSPSIAWKAPGRETLSSQDRDNLVYGTYMPSADTTGTTWTQSYTQVYPSSPDATIDITAPGTYEGIEYWGRVRIRSLNVHFKNCIFRGPNPANVTALRGCIQNYGSSTFHFKITDCTIDPSAWPGFNTTRAMKEGSVWVLGIHGGDFEMYRCEIVWCQDGVNYIGPTGSLEIAQAAFCLIESSWIHKGFYINDWYGPADGQPHCDAFQTNLGKNITIRNNVLGGQRVPAGYADTGRGVDGALGWGNGENLGDDFWNAALMLLQEVDNSDIRRIENVLIENNWLGGGTMTVNWAFSSSRPNHWDSTIFRNNKFFQRGANWGNFSPTNGTGGNGWYANINGTSWNGAYYGQSYGNVIYETGQPAPDANKT